MFEWLVNRKSAARTRVKQLSLVQRTWFEWSIENGAAVPTLVVEVLFETDPNGTNFRPASLDEIWAAVQDANPHEAVPITRVRVIPRKYDT